MKHLLVALASLSLLALPSGTDPQDKAKETRKPFVVHEWGTFTSVQGSDASTLEGIHHEEEALPHFVHARTRQGGWEQYGKKMETPVTYFHAPSAMKVRVAVAFPSGVFTQWFPDVTETRPPLPADRRVQPGDPRDGEEAIAAKPARGVVIQGGYLDWGEIDVLPPGETHKLFPADLEQFTWSAARETEANLVRSRNGELEKFLFYRGLGKFLAPLRVHGVRDAVVRLSAHDGRAKRILLLHVKDGRGAFARLGDLAAGDSKEVVFPAPDRPIEDFVRAVGSLLAAELAKEGLYADEAAAMVETWSRQYFRTPGRRVLYVLEQAFTDAVIPLTITPKPDELTRVMVARIECIEPEREAEMVSWAEDLVSREPAKRDGAEQRFKELGRFGEAALRRVAVLVKDRPEVYRAVEGLIEEVATVR